MGEDMTVQGNLIQQDHVINFAGNSLGTQFEADLHERFSHTEMSDDQKIILNFSGVKHLDSAALTMLVNLVFKQSKTHKIEVLGASYAITKALKLMGIDKHVVFIKNKISKDMR